VISRASLNSHKKTDSIFHKRAGDMTEGEKYFFIEISAEK
jgi:hypothetical protein